MARANEHDMELLHSAMCSYFLKLIGGEIPEVVEVTRTTRDDETGETATAKTWEETGFMVRPSAGEVAVMTKFLKDNAITGAVAGDGALADLEKQLQQRHQRRGPINERELKLALKEMGGDLLQ